MFWMKLKKKGVLFIYSKHRPLPEIKTGAQAWQVLNKKAGCESQILKFLEKSNQNPKSTGRKKYFLIMHPKKIRPHEDFRSKTIGQLVD